jgi:hypothetical protein
MRQLHRIFSDISCQLEKGNHQVVYRVQTDCVILRGDQRHEQLQNVIFRSDTITEIKLFENKITCKALVVGQALGFPLPIEIPFDCVRTVLKGREILYENKAFKN